MAYIGKDLVGILSPHKIVDVMNSPNGSTTTMSLSRTPGSVNNVEIYIDGVFQTPGVEYTLLGDVITFTTAPFNGASVIAVSGDDTAIITPEENTITGVKILDGTITNSNLATGITADKLLSGSTIPAGVNIDNVTGIPSGTEFTKSASDPAINTNSGSVGKMWMNTTSGNMFILTDTTTDDNIWYNVGGGEGNVAKAFGGLGGGTTSGFTSGGAAPTQDTIEKFPFASNSGGVDHGNLAMGRNAVGSCSSATDGYACGGFINGPPGGVGGFRENIDRFSFSSNITATDHGNLTRDTVGPVGCSSSTNGYAVGGHRGPTNIQSNIIDTFTFGSNSDATGHGDMSMAGRGVSAGHSSYTHGYTSGGEIPGPPSVVSVNIIDKFAFASNVTGTDHGDMTATRGYVAGQSSNTHGFTSGGHNQGPMSNVIDKFSFASSSNATDHGNLSVPRAAPSGQSSTTHGYCAGGYNGSADTKTIDKFSFANNTTAAGHGDLDVIEHNAAGHQV